MAERSEVVEDQAVRDGSAAHSVEAEITTSEDVPPGYKRTEVGVIPEDWAVKRVSDLASVKTGPFGSSLHERDYVEDGTPIVTVEHLGDYGLVHDNLPMVSEHDRKRLSRYELREGDIVFSRVGSVDRNSLVSVGENGWLFSGRLLRVRVTNSNVQSQYLSYHFHSEEFKQRVRDVAVGQTMASLNTKLLSGVLTTIPSSRDEQCAIATALSAADALIESLDRLIAKKRAIKKATMQQLVTGQTRLPGFTGEWEMKRFGEVLERRNLKSNQIQTTDYRKSGKYPVVDQGQEAVVGFTDREDKVFSCPTTGVIVFGDHTCTVKFVDFDFTVGADGTQVLQSKLDQCTRFYGYQLEYDGIQPTGYNRHFKFLREKSFPAPGKQEQIAIATVLSGMDTEIEALERRRDKARQIKQGMMQQLLTGRVRLVDENRKDASYG